MSEFKDLQRVYDNEVNEEYWDLHEDEKHDESEITVKWRREHEELEDEEEDKE